MRTRGRPRRWPRAAPACAGARAATADRGSPLLHRRMEPLGGPAGWRGFGPALFGSLPQPLRRIVAAFVRRQVARACAPRVSGATARPSCTPWVAPISKRSPWLCTSDPSSSASVRPPSMRSPTAASTVCSTCRSTELKRAQGFPNLAAYCAHDRAPGRNLIRLVGSPSFGRSDCTVAIDRGVRLFVTKRSPWPVRPPAVAARTCCSRAVIERSPCRRRSISSWATPGQVDLGSGRMLLARGHRTKSMQAALDLILGDARAKTLEVAASSPPGGRAPGSNSGISDAATRCPSCGFHRVVGDCRAASPSRRGGGFHPDSAKDDEALRLTRDKRCRRASLDNIPRFR